MPGREHTTIVAHPTRETQDPVQNHPHGAAKMLYENSKGRKSSRKDMPWSPEEKEALGGVKERAETSLVRCDKLVLRYGVNISSVCRLNSQ